MKRKNIILALAVLGLFITSIYVADVTKAVLATDQLDLIVGTYTKGKLLYTNSTVTDYLVSNIDVTVEDTFVTSDTADSIFLVRVAYERVAFDTALVDFGEYTKLESLHTIAKVNRTDLPCGELYIGNSTFGARMSTLHNTTAYGLYQTDNVKVTFDNGTEYIFGDIVSPALEAEVGQYVLAWLLFNALADITWQWTFLAITNTANVADDISYDPAYGTVIDKPALITSAGKSYDTIHVEYAVPTYGFGLYTTTSLDVFYDARTGLILKSIETFGSEKAEFIPVEVKNVKGIPFSTTAIVAALTVLSTLALIVRKRKTK